MHLDGILGGPANYNLLRRFQSKLLAVFLSERFTTSPLERHGC
jgi:hypothetical protein